MTGKHVELKRKFTTASKAEEPHSYLFRSERGHLSWPDVLEMSRVVVLAEAGSGKSQEFEHQRDALIAGGHLAVLASVSEVARPRPDKGAGERRPCQTGGVAWRFDGHVLVLHRFGR